MIANHVLSITGRPELGFGLINRESGRLVAPFVGSEADSLLINLRRNPEDRLFDKVGDVGGMGEEGVGGSTLILRLLLSADGGALSATNGSVDFACRSGFCVRKSEKNTLVHQW